MKLVSSCSRLHYSLEGKKKRSHKAIMLQLCLRHWRLLPVKVKDISPDRDLFTWSLRFTIPTERTVTIDMIE